jgi:hypothetical protein
MLHVSQFKISNNALRHWFPSRLTRRVIEMDSRAFRIRDSNPAARRGALRQMRHFSRRPPDSPPEGSVILSEMRGVVCFSIYT